MGKSMGKEIQATLTPITDILISVTSQVPDGCVTASARAFIPHLGVNFETDFLPRLQKYSLDFKNPENNHMLGVGVVAADLGLDVEICRKNPLQGDILPDDASERAKLIHPQVVSEICTLADRGEIKLTVGELDEHILRQKLEEKISAGSYALVFLDWDKWNPDVQKRYGVSENPRHIITVFRIMRETIWAIDPSLESEENPVSTTVEKLLNALNEIQQIVFIGKKK
jgi:hypothetical protein